MSKLAALIRSETGAFAVIFGLVATTLFVVAGSAIDLAITQKVREAVQITLDSAALSMQPQIYRADASDRVTRDTRRLLEENVVRDNVTIDALTTEIDTSAGRLLLNATVSRPTLILRVIGIRALTMRLKSESNRNKSRIELTMVLDNSFSMSGSRRMGQLKSAAKLAIDILSGGARNPENIFFGLVPFSTMVNVGAANRNAPWIDQEGVSPVNWDNFDDDDNDKTGRGPKQRLSRLKLYSGIKNVSWKGCVEMRPHKTSLPAGRRLDITDIPPNPRNPASYFVPIFVPDARDPPLRSVRIPTSYIRDDGGTCTAPVRRLSSRERQERVCKYMGVKIATPNTDFTPNGDCLDAEIQPLTNDMSRIKRAIDSMIPKGLTNIHAGAIWGWRVLSPGEPFSEGSQYGRGGVKYMIIMTDGHNTYPAINNLNGSTQYTAYGYPYNRRLGYPGISKKKAREEMNRRTEMTCANAKANGITILTIGLGTYRGSSSGKMLRRCASSEKMAFFLRRPSELKKTFESIARQLAKLHLSQ